MAEGDARAARSRSNSDPMPWRRYAGSTRAVQLTRPARLDRSTTPVPTTTPSHSASSSVRSGRSMARISATVADRSSGMIANRTARQAS